MKEQSEGFCKECGERVSEATGCKGTYWKYWCKLRLEKVTRAYIDPQRVAQLR